MNTPYQDALNEHGSKAAAARALGMAVTTFKSRFDKETKQPRIYLEKPAKNEDFNKSPVTKILYFTDAHNQPGMNNDRFRWLAQFTNDQRPDVLLDGGDFDDFQSLCSQERNDTYKGRLKPSLARDLEASAEARRILHDGIKHKCRRVLTKGNHEHRLHTFENNNPEMYGIPTNIYADILKATGWEAYEYGEYVSIAGVDFIHIPLITQQTPVGGEMACRKIADKSPFDVVFGHTHTLNIWSSLRFRDNKSVIAFNGGCFMPENYIPPYAKNTKKEYWYGCHVIIAAEGRIKSVKSWHISELEGMYK